MGTYILIVCLLGAATASYSVSGVEKITKASDFFGQRLYQLIASGNENIIFSPFSVHLAMSMTSTGAGGVTKTEMTSTLGLDVFNGETATNEAYNDVIEQLNSAPNVTTILTANAVFVNQNQTVNSTFISNVRNYYLANAATFDPADPAGPERVINDFVENKTNGLIQDLIPPNAVDTMTVLVVVNTLYFKGSWDNPFPKPMTRLADFNTGQGIIQVQTMFDSRTMKIKRNFYGADIGELTIGQGRFSFFIVLPLRVNGLANQESALIIPGRIVKLFKGLTSVRVNITLPKVNILSRFSLKDSLTQLGIVKAFDQQQADFTGINRDGNIYISEVFQQAVIETNEDGTVAAAATAIVIGTTSLEQPPTETFLVNRPFLFFIRDNFLRLLLFQGRYLGQ